jgi:hypothetical protein
MGYLIHHFLSHASLAWIFFVSCSLAWKYFCIAHTSFLAKRGFLEREVHGRSGGVFFIWWVKKHAFT